VFLSVLGFGTGNYKDSTAEKLADHGNGNYAYVDTDREARKVFVEQMSGTLVTIAKDVKIQVDFNPAQVAAYRLIGYENRMLRAEDFLDDQKDAGDIGAGHAVTAFYEVVPPGAPLPVPEVEPSKYAAEKPAVAETVAADAASDELLTVRLRYKQPDADESEPLRVPVTDAGGTFEQASEEFRFAAAVAEFGMLLRDSPHKGDASFAHVVATAENSRGQDRNGYRDEFVDLAEAAKRLKGE
jgi:Ca-activated chloride channel family protein